MLTVCPKCALTLAVTAADLRVAQGYVRCGRCSSVFNALARLSEDRQPLAPEGAGAPAPASAPTPAPVPTPSRTEQSVPLPPPPDETLTLDTDVPEEALEFNPEKTDAVSVFVQPRPDPQWEAATGSFKAMVAANQEPVQEGEREAPLEVEIDSTFLSAIMAQAKPAAAAAAQPVEPPRAPVSAPPAAEAPAAKTRAAESLAQGAPGERAAPLAAEDELALLLARPGTRAATLAQRGGADQAGARRRWWWTGGAAAAVLVLLAQILNHYRDELAASARFGRPISAVYRALGITLAPHWDLHAYDVRQLGASVDADHPGQITVHASIKNGAPQAQPLPLLRVTLQDRFGNRIATRDVPPRFYVPGAVPAAALLGAGQRIDAEMAFADPGAQAVGFELDACLPASAGGTACANDAGTR